MITRGEFFDYAEKYNLEIWSKECSERAMKSIEKLEKIEQIVNRVHHTGLEPSKAYELIQEVMEGDDGTD